MFERIKFWAARFIVISAVGLAMCGSTFAQENIQFSQGQVNDSFAHTMSIPLMSYKGRGIDLPITLNYSSKVWRIDNLKTVYSGTWINYQTVAQAIYSENATAGWKTSLDLPVIEWPKADDVYTPGGRPCQPGPCTSATYRIDRVTVHMPDGSSHELRQSDAAQNSGSVDTSGTFYSVDGSRLRYDSTDADTGTLYLPDGTTYVLDAGDGQLIDRHGNTLSYDASSREWTDTLGRTITMPFPASPAATDYSYELPGLAGVNDGVQEYTFKFRELEDVLESGAGDLRFMATHYLPTPSATPTNEGGSNFPIQQGDSTDSLFNSDPVDEGAPTLVVGKGQSHEQLFNPIVLREVVLPDGRSYVFDYNIYGEITKVTYPTGAYEHYSIAKMATHYVLSQPYDQADRGITSREVSEDGTGADAREWTYSSSPGSYSIVNPDGTCTVRITQQLGTPIHLSPWYYEYWDWNFVDPANDATIETRVYSPSSTPCTGSPLRRELTAYERTANYLSTWSNGLQVYAYRHLRPTRKTVVLFEGTGSALAQTTTYSYDTTNQYTTGVDETQVNTYNYVVVSNTSSTDTAQAGVISAISTGTLAKTVETTYSTNSTYQNANILGLPTSVTIKDSSGTVVSRSEMTYDDSGYVPSGTTRGMPTTMKTWDSTKGASTSSGSYLITHATFDQWGNRTVATDAKGYSTTTAYDSTYHAFPTGVTSPVPDDSNTYGSDSAFTSSTSFDVTTGLVLSTTDINGQTTEMEYDDPLLRPTKVTAPNGQETITEYGAGADASSRWIKVKTQIDADQWSQTKSFYDGLGRTYKTQKTDLSDPLGDIFTFTCFDLMGRVEKTSNPIRGVSSSTCSPSSSLEWTVPEYDDLSRTKKVTSSDSSEVKTTFGLSVSGVIGTTKTVEDQAGRKRTGITDALGNMIRVIEDPDASSPLITDYVFDTLGNLRKTTQGDQTRYFSYDSLGRVLRAKQIEQDVNTGLALSSADPITSNNAWTVGYSYDDNGNITSTTDAKNNSITATYDRLNRIKTRDYSDTGTPDVAFYYDGRGLGVSAPANSNGKTTKINNGVSETRYTTFDLMGRVVTSEQRTNSETYPFEYTYNLAGALIEETYPSTRKVKFTLSPDGELAQVQSKKNSSSGYWKYADSFSYDAAGAVTKMQLGNGRWETALYNDRQQVRQIGLGSTSGSQDLLKLEFRYGLWSGSTLDESKNNGSMAEQKITVPAVGSNPTFTAVQKYAYDSLNRIYDAAETVSSTQTWKQTFSYDRYGNRRFDTSGSNTTTVPGGCSAAVCNPDINTSNNQLSASQGYDYDENGSLIEDALGQRFSYDAENHQKQFFSASNNGSTPDATYHYDGVGRRVKKVVGSEVTIFVYDAAGQLVSEYASTIASAGDAEVSYLTTDHLGSPRIITNANGAVINRKDFTAFGETVTSSQRISGTSGNHYDDPQAVIRQDYTGYQKDGESGLEFAQARYYSAGHGRFTSVDPLGSSAAIRNPQSLNRYSYSLNSPYKFTDPLGLIPVGQRSREIEEIMLLSMLDEFVEDGGSVDAEWVLRNFHGSAGKSGGSNDDEGNLPPPVDSDGAQEKDIESEAGDAGAQFIPVSTDDDLTERQQAEVDAAVTNYKIFIYDAYGPGSITHNTHKKNIKVETPVPQMVNGIQKAVEDIFKNVYVAARQGELTTADTQQARQYMVAAFTAFGGPDNKFLGTTKSGDKISAYYGKPELAVTGAKLAREMITTAVSLAARHGSERQDRINREIRRGVSRTE